MDEQIPSDTVNQERFKTRHGSDNYDKGDKEKKKRGKEPLKRHC